MSNNAFQRTASKSRNITILEQKLEELFLTQPSAVRVKLAGFRIGLRPQLKAEAYGHYHRF